MQIYDGPTNRLVKKTKSNRRLIVDGTVGNLESRNVFVTQSFKLEQFRDSLVHEELPDEWVYPEENDFVIPIGGRVPFQKDHVIEDKLLLNRSFKNVTFQPYGCSNFLNIDNNTQVQLAPLLCSEKQFNNVCKKPEVTFDVSNSIPDYVDVNLSAYGRIWIGCAETLDAQVTNRTGDAPYLLVNECADVHPANNAEIFVWKSRQLHSSVKMT